jgi:hypothetical protein
MIVLMIVLAPIIVMLAPLLTTILSMLHWF